VYALIAAIALTSGMERGGIIPALIPNEAVLGGAFGVALPLLIRDKERRVPTHGLLILGMVALVAGTMLAPMFFQPLQGIGYSTSQIIRMAAPVQYVMLFWVVRGIPTTQKQRDNLLFTMWVCAAIVSFVGVLQAFGIGPVTSLLSRFYASEHGAAAAELGRVTSLMSAWNVLGTFLMINLLLIRAAWKPKDMHPLQNFAMLGIVGLVVICQFISGSFAGLGGLVIGLVLLEFIEGRINGQFVLLMGGLALVGLAVSPLLADRLEYQFGGGDTWIPQTLAFRFELWQEIFWPLAVDNFWWGMGPGIFGRLSWGWAENHYLYLVIRTGFPSLLGHFVWLILTLIWLFGIIFKPDNPSHELAVAAATILIVMSIMGMTNEVFTFSGVMEYIWIVLALIAGAQGDYLRE
ncbi:MAG: hypothetical protein GYB64_09365, partial [Chloroflexi bacterium]|nr:hypothetical protein [Chloroflexota bacterium]